MLFLITLVWSLKVFLSQGAVYLSISSLIFSVCVFFFNLKNVIGMKVVRPNKYQLDTLFVDRVYECKILCEFLNSALDSNDSEYRIFSVTGVMGIGKTLLLREVADRINSKNKPYINLKKTCAYYVNFDKCTSVFQNVKNELGISCEENMGSLCEEIRKTSFEKNSILIIDNFERDNMRGAKEFAQAICKNSNGIIIILGITTGNEIEPGIVPARFFENELRLLERKCQYELNEDTRKKIINHSSGIPAYIRVLYKANANREKHYYSNSEEIHDYIKMKIANLSEESRELFSIILNKKHIEDKVISSKEVFAISSNADVSHLTELFDASLIHYNIPQEECFIENFIYEVCFRNYNKHRASSCRKIYEFHFKRNNKNLISAMALLLSNEPIKNYIWIEEVFNEQYKNKSYFFFKKLGISEENHHLNPELISNRDTYDLYRYYYLSWLLQLGKYPKAYEVYTCYEKSSNPLPTITKNTCGDFEFDLQYLIADLVHLSNNFNLAIDNALILLAKEQTIQQQCQCQYLIAHCLKHIGSDLSQADILFSDIQKKKKDIPVELYIQAVYSRVSIHLFWNDVDFDYRSCFKELSDIKNEFPQASLAFAGAMRHKAIYLLKMENNLAEALTVLENANITLEKAQQRRIYDFYFEIAEVKRLMKNNGQSTENTSHIQIYYDKALDFAEEVGDYNLLSCVRLGKILLEYSDKRNDEDWKDYQIACIGKIIQTAKEYNLSINEAYAQVILYYIKNQPVPQESILYFKRMKYLDCFETAKNINAKRPVFLKLTVM